MVLHDRRTEIFLYCNIVMRFLANFVSAFIIMLQFLFLLKGVIESINSIEIARSVDLAFSTIKRNCEITVVCLSIICNFEVSSTFENTLGVTLPKKTSKSAMISYLLYCCTCSPINTNIKIITVLFTMSNNCVCFCYKFNATKDLLKTVKDK